MFVVEDSSQTIDSIERGVAENGFLEMLDRLSDQGRKVSPSPSSAKFAPKIMMKMPEHGRLKRRDLERAMESLFSVNLIKVESYGPPSKNQRRIIRAENEDGRIPGGQ